MSILLCTFTEYLSRFRVLFDDLNFRMHECDSAFGGC